jgi:riboflavin transporter FmnP
MEQSRKFFSATRIAMIALFATLSAILYAIGFPISAIFPSWLELNFSDIPALIGTFALGPVSGVLIVLVKIIIKLLIKPTSTAFVGELADFLIGCAFVLPAGLIYQRKKTFSGAILAMAIGAILSTAVAILANWLILVPFYLQLYFKGSWTPLVSIMQMIFPSCTQETFYNFYLWGSVLPFNLMRCLIAILVTLPIYKHISKVINKFNEKITPTTDNGYQKLKKINIGAIIASIVIIIIFVVIILVKYYSKI